MQMLEQAKFVGSQMPVRYLYDEESLISDHLSILILKEQWKLVFANPDVFLLCHGKGDTRRWQHFVEFS